MNHAGRKKKRQGIKEAADRFLALKVQDPERVEKLMAQGVAKKDANYQMEIISGLAAAAARGDTRAAKLILDLLEKAPADDASHSFGIPLSERAGLLREIAEEVGKFPENDG